MIEVAIGSSDPPFKLFGSKNIPNLKLISLSIARNNNYYGFNPLRLQKKKRNK
jgi:hypothetical protein